MNLVQDNPIQISLHIQFFNQNVQHVISIDIEPTTNVSTIYNAIDRYHIMLGCILGAKDNIGILLSRFFNKKNHSSKSKS